MRTSTILSDDIDSSAIQYWNTRDALRSAHRTRQALTLDADTLATVQPVEVGWLDWPIYQEA